jgi:hypothetical protein
MATDVSRKTVGKMKCIVCVIVLLAAAAAWSAAAAAMTSQSFTTTAAAAAVDKYMLTGSNNDNIQESTSGDVIGHSKCDTELMASSGEYGKRNRQAQVAGDVPEAPSSVRTDWSSSLHYDGANRASQADERQKSSSTHEDRSSQVQHDAVTDEQDSSPTLEDRSSHMQLVAVTGGKEASCLKANDGEQCQSDNADDTNEIMSSSPTVADSGSQHLDGAILLNGGGSRRNNRAVVDNAGGVFVGGIFLSSVETHSQSGKSYSIKHDSTSKTSAGAIHYWMGTWDGPRRKRRLRNAKE